MSNNVPKYKNPPSEGRSLRSIRGDSPGETSSFVEKSPSNRKNIISTNKNDDDFEVFSVSSNKGSTNSSFLNALKKNNQAAPDEQQKPAFLQTNLQPFLKKRVYVSGDQEAKKSTPNQASEKRKSAEFDFKANLGKILDDKDTTIDFVAKRISDNEFDAYLAEEESKRESKSLKDIRSKNVLTYTYNKKPAAPADSGRNYTPNANDEGEGKKYSAYEDWRILDTVDQLLLNEAKTSLASRHLWTNIKDPSTGRKLLDDKRSSESMRERYKRHLSWLDDDAKEKLEIFARKHGAAEMKNFYSIIKKVDSVKQLIAISKNPNYDPDSNSKRDTRYHTADDDDDDREFTKMSKQQNSRLERGEVEEDFAEENFHSHSFGIPFDNEENSRTKKSFKPKSPPKSASEKSGKFLIAKMLQGKNSVDGDDIENFQEHEEQDVFPTFGNQKKTVKNFIEVSENDENVEIKTDSDIIVVEKPAAASVVKSSKKRKREDPPQESQIPEDLILKKVRLTIDYDKKALCPSIVFQERKPFDQNFVIDENLMIYVDMENEVRDFYSEEPVWTKKLKELASKYEVDLESLKETLKQVSGDVDDLERYLESKDPVILWTAEEDEDLLQNNQTALKYLRLLKGPESIQKRMQYLQES